MSEEPERKTRVTKRRTTSGKAKSSRGRGEASKRRPRKREEKTEVKSEARRSKRGEARKKEEKKPKARPRRVPPEPISGILLNYQLGPGVQRSRYGLVRLEGIEDAGQAAKYIGCTVILHYNERTAVKGRVIGLHGRGGVLRVRFRRGLNPDALTKAVTVH